VSKQSRAALDESAPAKVNLTLRVLGRRRDGYHNIESLVAFAKESDRLAFVPGGPLKLVVRGPAARAAGRPTENLVLKAARLLAAEVEGLTLGRFTLTKNLPVAAGLGGGSADAAAALRLLARANHIKRSDPRILKIARQIGADVSVCLDPRARLMRGIGEILSDPIRIPKLPVVLINPGAALGTECVFARYDSQKPRADAKQASKAMLIPQWRSAFVAMLAVDRNDLEPSAIALVPAIATVLEVLRDSSGCRLARMSGSGATCFGIFPSSPAAAAAARKIKAAHPRWWVRASVLS
jgi:4-diphosphocytidyl-2-C-methyl-D-erythritol kinase